MRRRYRSAVTVVALGAAVALLLPFTARASPSTMSPSSSPGQPSSPFPYRGIIEGFYGTPYRHADRVDLIRWEAAHGMNTFVDAPKEDPYVRSLWREQYPPVELSQMLDEVRLAARLGINWIPDVGPGIPEIPSPNVAVPDRDICFSCPSDLQVLVEKFRPFVAAGAKVVMVSFDDTVKASSWQQDAAAYGVGDAAYGTMNADLLNRLAAALPGVTVLTVPSDYSGTSSTTYLSAFAAHLNPAVVVMWTGTAVVAPTVKGSDAAAFDQVVGRKVVVWDNYPANDYAGGIYGDPTNLFLGPVVGRGRDLVGPIQGILANPMVEWQSSKLALATLADDLNDPYTYNPEQSWQASLSSFAGANARLVAELADNSRSSPLGQTESIVFQPEATAFLTAYQGADWPADAAALQAELEKEQAAAGELAETRFNPGFMSEAAAFLARLRLNAQAGAAALKSLEAQRPSIDASVEPAGHGQEVVTGSATAPSLTGVETASQGLAALAEPLATDHHNVHGDRFAIDVDGKVYVNQNLMDQFLAKAAQLTGTWLPTAPRATSSVNVTVNGQAVPSTFSVTLPSGTAVRIVATDGAGGQTAATLSGVR